MLERGDGGRVEEEAVDEAEAGARQGRAEGRDLGLGAGDGGGGDGALADGVLVFFGIECGLWTLLLVFGDLVGHGVL